MLQNKGIADQDLTYTHSHSLTLTHTLTLSLLTFSTTLGDNSHLVVSLLAGF